jgi:hypothetical protein
VNPEPRSGAILALLVIELVSYFADGRLPMQAGHVHAREAAPPR